MSTILRLHLALQSRRIKRELRKTPRTVTVRPATDPDRPGTREHLDNLIAVVCAIGLVVSIAELLARRVL